MIRSLRYLLSGFAVLSLLLSCKGGDVLMRQLNDFYSSDLNTSKGPTTQVFYAPIFFDGDLEEGYTMMFHYGGRSKRSRITINRSRPIGRLNR